MTFLKLFRSFPSSSDSFSSFRWPVGIPDLEELAGKVIFAVFCVFNVYGKYRILQATFPGLADKVLTGKVRFPRFIPTFPT